MPLSTAAFPCCRDHDLFAPVEEYPQRIQRTPGDEAYWFGWDSSFDGKATIRIAKLRDDVMVFRVYRASRFGKVRRFRGLLTNGRLVPARRRRCRRELLDDSTNLAHYVALSAESL
jgi:hypothetical protein